MDNNSDQNDQKPTENTAIEPPDSPQLNTDQTEDSLTDGAAPEVITPMQNSSDLNASKPRSKGLVTFLRFLVVGGGLFIVFVIGLGISFSACFTIKGPPPPECGPVSFVSLILMPGASLLFLIPIARKIK